MYCVDCGSSLVEGQEYCGDCGRAVNLKVQPGPKSEGASVNTDSFSEQVRDGFLHMTEKVNNMVGEEGAIQVNLRDVFSDVFKRHSKEDGELLFISGTKMTTPRKEDIVTTWPKPWLFSRVFVVLALTFILLYISVDVFDNGIAYPGMIIVGSFAIPFSLLILFWEMNAPRNISIYEVTKMLFVGGAASIFASLFLFNVFPVYELSFTGAIIVSIVEETGKLAIIACFIHKLKSKYILNGLLIGAAIGAGFAAFESAGYAYVYGSYFGEGSIIFLRAWMSIGTHTAWAAISGAALVYVKREESLRADHFKDGRFIRLFLVPVILHAVWDMPLAVLHFFNLGFIALILVAWIFIFSLINAGLKQIDRSRNLA